MHHVKIISYLASNPFEFKVIVNFPLIFFASYVLLTNWGKVSRVSTCDCQWTLWFI